MRSAGFGRNCRPSPTAGAMSMSCGRPATTSTGDDPGGPPRRSGGPTSRSGVRLVPGPAAIALGAAAAADLALVALVLCAGRGAAGTRGGAARIAVVAPARALLRRALVRFL